MLLRRVAFFMCDRGYCSSQLSIPFGSTIVMNDKQPYIFPAFVKAEDVSLAGFQM